MLNFVLAFLGPGLSVIALPLCLALPEKYAKTPSWLSLSSSLRSLRLCVSAPSALK
jgi:hypothetical protein